MNKRLKALATLTRLQDRVLQARSAELVNLQNMQNQVQASRDDLDRMRKEECGVESLEGMIYVGRFIANVRKEDARLQQAEMALEGHVRDKRREVMSAYRDLKSTGFLSDRIKDRIQDEAEHRDRVEIDERNIISYARSSSG